MSNGTLSLQGEWFDEWKDAPAIPAHTWEVGEEIGWYNLWAPPLPTVRSDQWYQEWGFRKVIVKAKTWSPSLNGDWKWWYYTDAFSRWLPEYALRTLMGV